jgi:hypothetical protein
MADVIGSTLSSSSAMMQASHLVSERMKRSLKRPTTCCVRLGAEARVHVHGERVELLERRHRLEQQHDDAAALDRLDGAREQVGRQRLKVLQHAHAVGLAHDGVRLFVVAVANVGGRDEQFKRIIFRRFL